MWGLIRLHSNQCTNANCPVPRCKDFKASRRRDAARADAQRRAAYLEYRKREQAQFAQQGGAMLMAPAPPPMGMVPVQPTYMPTPR